ncbi:Inhibitor of growth protein [Aphelenchoides fujianensis]|nr:Inhibitor of growth protein [Aphelenchoides fujianensis]
MNAPLSRFMKKLADLPPVVKANFAEISQLDRDCEEKEREFGRACFELLARSHTTGGSKRAGGKGAPTPQEQYEEILNILSDWEEKTTEKLQLASECYQEVDRKINDLDKAYGKFAQNVAKTPQTEKKKSSGKTATSQNRKRKARERDVDTDATLDSLDFDSPLVEMPVDPNEPTYCNCHRVSFGNMIACEGAQCPIEWFHFQALRWIDHNAKRKVVLRCVQRAGRKRGRKSAAVEKK